MAFRIAIAAALMMLAPQDSKTGRTSATGKELPVDCRAATFKIW